MDSESGNTSDSAPSASTTATLPQGAAPQTAPAPAGPRADGEPAPAGHAWSAIVADFLERAGWSAGEQFAAVLLTTSTATTIAGLPWAAALVTAVGAAIVSVLTTLVEYAAKPLRRANYWTELALRLVKTFAASLLGSMGAQAAFDFLHFNWIAALNLAAVATLGALAKGLLARNSVGIPNASTLSVQTYDRARRS